MSWYPTLNKLWGNLMMSDVTKRLGQIHVHLLLHMRSCSSAIFDVGRSSVCWHLSPRLHTWFTRLTCECFLRYFKSIKALLFDNIMLFGAFFQFMFSSGFCLWASLQNMGVYHWCGFTYYYYSDWWSCFHCLSGRSIPVFAIDMCMTKILVLFR